MTPRIRITTPYTHGEHVKNAQWLLSGHNRQKLRTYFGAIDGQYGPITAAATAKMKFDLGYPDARCNQTWGPYIYGYLIGAGAPGYKRRPMSYQLTAIKRRKATPEGFREKALSLAMAEIGYTESPPFSNNTKFGSWYGINPAPWCAMFASWCYTSAGHSLHYSYVPSIYDDAVNVRNHLSITNRPGAGDLCCMTFTTANQHVGLFNRWITADTFEMVSGNTGLTNLSEGGAVLLGTFSVSNVAGFVRVS